MGHFVERFWDSRGRLTREARPDDEPSRVFEAYVPDALRGWSPLLESRIWQHTRLAEDAAKAACKTENSEAVGHAHWMLVRLESAASSLIEGVRVAPRHLALTEARQTLIGKQPDRHESVAIGDIAAIEHALRVGSTTQPVTVEDIRAIHRGLMGNDPIAGEIRSVQNWIGAPYSTPLRAVFVSPPAHLVPELLEDLVESINEDGHPPLVHAAMVHAQFETIHPFADGNGRTGRALIQLMLRRAGLTASALPVSLTLVHSRHTYIDALNAGRSLDDVRSPQRSTALAGWINLLADAVRSAAEATTLIATEVALIRRYCEDLLASRTTRTSGTTDALLKMLTTHPMLTVNSAATLLGANPRSAARAIQRLCDATIVTPADSSKRNRIYQATDIISLYEDLATINPGWQAGRRRQRYWPDPSDTPHRKR